MADGQGSDSKKGWKPATRAVRGGLMRSPHGEISEALYLTSGYSYDSAEQAMRRMAGEEDGFVYSRYGSPTCEMLQQRLALIEPERKAQRRQSDERRDARQREPQAAVGAAGFWRQGFGRCAHRVLPSPSVPAGRRLR